MSASRLITGVMYGSEDRLAPALARCHELTERGFKGRPPRERKEILVAALGGKCMDCGIVGPPEIYHFDHRDPEQKLMGVSRLLSRKDVDALLAEVMKCDLVCANCHAIRTRNSAAVSAKRTRTLKANVAARHLAEEATEPNG